ncbi:hypothetical protein D9M73_109110 [compost metagenome]
MADKFAARGLGDRLAEAGLANAGRADEAQDRPLQLVGARLYREIFDDPVLDLFERIVVLVEHRLRRRNILADLGLLAPRQAQQHVEIVAHDGGLGRHRRHRLELLQLRRRLGAGFLGQFERRDLVGQLGDLIAFALVALIAELTLDRLQLLVEVIFALGLLHLALHAAFDLLLDLQHAKLALHEGEHHLESLGRIAFDQQRLLVGHLDLDVGGDRVGELARILNLAELHRGFGGQLAVELGIILELLDHRTHQRGHFGIGGVERLFTVVALQHFDVGSEIAVGLHQASQRGAALALDQHAHRAIGQFQQLQNDGGDADFVQIIAIGIVFARVELRDQENLLVGGHRRLQSRDRLVATNEQRHDHVGEHDDVAQRQHGIGVGGRRGLGRGERSFGHGYSGVASTTRA